MDHVGLEGGITLGRLIAEIHFPSPMKMSWTVTCQEVWTALVKLALSYHTTSRVLNPNVRIAARDGLMQREAEQHQGTLPNPDVRKDRALLRHLMSFPHSC